MLHNMNTIPSISPFAVPFPAMPEVKGVQLSVAASNTRYKGRDDLLLLQFSEGTQIAGVFTQNSLPGEPILWNKAQLPAGVARAIIVNAGIANVLAGKKGVSGQEAWLDATSQQLNIPKEQIFVGSTGIIGEPLDAEGMKKQLPQLQQQTSAIAWEAAASAIMTTDTFPKGVTRTATIGAETVTINGIAKGSGMIAPNMATMLAYVCTDASLPACLLQTLLDAQIPKSFNAITVDSDTSTSDMVLLCATQQVEHWQVEDADAYELTDFKEKLQEVLTELALLVVKDGEGISKCITVQVSGAKNDDEAQQVALSVANSPLVKTAIAGEDPNWGRIAMAIGKTGCAVNRAGLAISMGDIAIVAQGDLLDSYEESAAAAYMKQPDILLNIALGVAEGSATVYGSDLTHDYITINADYRS